MTSAPRRRIVEKLGFQIAVLLAAALLPLTLISMVNSARAVPEVIARSEAALAGETMLAAANEIRIIQEARGSAAALAALIGPFLGDEGACVATLRNFVAVHQVYSVVSFVPLDGQVRCSSTGTVFDASKSPIFPETARAARARISVAHKGVISGAYVLEVSHPVFSNTGTYLGYIDMSLPQAKPDVTLVAGRDAGPIELTTFDRDGAVLTSTGGIDNGGTVLPRDRSLKSLVSDHLVTFSGKTQSGQSRVFSVVPLVPGELFALSAWRSEPGSSLNATLISVPFLSPALVWIASLVVAWLSVEWLVNRHIRRLNLSINAFAGGNRMITDVDVSGAPLEIREMAAAFEQMTEAVMRDEAELENTLHQKEVLLREVHHRVKNNLQMITSIMNMHGRKARTPETKQVIKGLEGRVMSLATIHRELYETKGVGDVHAAELLGAIARQTVNVAAGPGRRFDLRLQLDNIRMTPDQAAPLALLVGEGLMNAVACARPVAQGMSPLDLRLIQSGADTVVLQLDGTTGEANNLMPEAMEESVSLSAQLMTVFAMQLGGKFEETMADGQYSLRIAFQLRPLAEGENRHAAHTEEPM